MSQEKRKEFPRTDKGEIESRIWLNRLADEWKKEHGDKLVEVKILQVVTADENGNDTVMVFAKPVLRSGINGVYLG